MTQNSSPERNRLARIAMITLVLGVINLVRWGPEMAGKGMGSGRYLAVLVFDLAVGVSTLIGGAGLWRGRPEGWKFFVLAWGALAASSGLFGGGMLEAFLHHGKSWYRATEPFWLSFPRALFYGVTLAVFPYVLWEVLTQPRSERPPLPVMGAWFMAGAFAACGVGFLILGVNGS